MVRIISPAVFMIIFFIIIVGGCERIGPTDNSSIDLHDDVSSDLTGLWSGVVDGIEPYFNENPRITIELSQADSILMGSIRTSDGSFKNSHVLNGTYFEPHISFEAKQSDFYTGAILSFNGILNEDTIRGTWRRGQLDSGSWYMVKKEH